MCVEIHVIRVSFAFVDYTPPHFLFHSQFDASPALHRVDLLPVAIPNIGTELRQIVKGLN